MRRSAATGLALILAGCATVDDQSRESFRLPGFPITAFRSEPIGVLPILARGNERAYLDSATRVFSDEIEAASHDRPLIPPDELILRIKEGGAEEVYKTLAARYAIGNVVEEQPFRELAKASGVRFLLVTVLSGVERVEGTTQVQVTGQVWDSESGQVAWEAVGEGRGFVVLFFPVSPSSFERSMTVAARGLIHTLPR